VLRNPRRGPDLNRHSYLPLGNTRRWCMLILVSRRTIMALSAVALLLVAAYPPWVFTCSVAGSAVAAKPAGHAWLFDPPTPERASAAFGVALDWGRLTLLGVVLGSATLVALILPRSVIVHAAATRKDLAAGAARTLAEAPIWVAGLLVAYGPMLVTIYWAWNTDQLNPRTRGANQEAIPHTVIAFVISVAWAILVDWLLLRRRAAEADAA